MKYNLLILAILFFALSLLTGIAICKATEFDPFEETEAFLNIEDPPAARSWWNRTFSPQIPYDTTDRLLLATLIATNAADAGTTMAALDHGATEMNPLLGSHPSDGRILLVKTAGLAVMTLLANHMPSQVRKIFLGTTSILFGGIALHNMNVIREVD